MDAPPPHGLLTAMSRQGQLPGQSEQTHRWLMHPQRISPSTKLSRYYTVNIPAVAMTVPPYRSSGLLPSPLYTVNAVLNVNRHPQRHRSVTHLSVGSWCSNDNTSRPGLFSPGFDEIRLIIQPRLPTDIAYCLTSIWWDPPGNLHLRVSGSRLTKVIPGLHLWHGTYRNDMYGGEHADDPSPIQSCRTMSNVDICAEIAVFVDHVALFVKCEPGWSYKRYRSMQISACVPMTAVEVCCWINSLVTTVQPVLDTVNAATATSCTESKVK